MPTPDILPRDPCRSYLKSRRVGGLQRDIVPANASRKLKWPKTTVSVPNNTLDSSAICCSLPKCCPAEVIEGIEASALQEALVGRTIKHAHRKGKQMWLEFDKQPCLMLHFGKHGASSTAVGFALWYGQHTDMHRMYSSSEQASVDVSISFGLLVNSVDVPDSFISQQSVSRVCPLCVQQPSAHELAVMSHCACL